MRRNDGLPSFFLFRFERDNPLIVPLFREANQPCDFGFSIHGWRQSHAMVGVVFEYR
jgi:hypothetical protein